MKRQIVCAFFLGCFSILLISCSFGNSEAVLAVQSALDKTNAQNSIAVTITTTATVKPKGENTSVAESSRCYWRHGEDILQEFWNSSTQGDFSPDFVLAKIDNTFYQNDRDKWIKTATATESFDYGFKMKEMTYPDDYSIQKNGSIFTLKSTQHALENQLQCDIHEAQISENALRQSDKLAEARAQAVLIENLKNSRYLERYYEIEVDELGFAIRGASFVAFEGYQIDTNTPGEYTVGTAQTLEFLTEWEIAEKENQQIINKIDAVRKNID